MAVIRDPVPAFAFFQPTSIEDAQALLCRYGADAWVLAGGLDSLDWVKDRIRRPEALVDLGNIPALKGVRDTRDGIEIGAMTTLADLVAHPLIRSRYPLIRRAAEAAAAPQNRTQGTVGGNVSQDTRCSYYRAGLPCLRAGGDTCHAQAPEGNDREHAILHAERCVAVNPSDIAPVLIALDADLVIRRADGAERVVSAEQYFVGADANLARMTILGPGDLLTTIRLRSADAAREPAFGAPRTRFYFEKAHDSQAWDFALASVASSITISGTTVERIRLAVNGVAARPLRLHAVETFVNGRTISEAVAEQAAELSVEGARPLRSNGYKVGLLRSLVKRAILSAT